MDNITLRPVNNADTEFLYSIMNHEAILDALNEVPTNFQDWLDAITEWSRDEDEEDYIIYLNGESVGWLGINGLSSVDKAAYLKLAAILPPYHSRGIGYTAICQIIDLLKKRGYAKLILYTDQANRKAQACYRKCGFVTTELLTEEMSNGKTVARCKMELVLNNI